MEISGVWGREERSKTESMNLRLVSTELVIETKEVSVRRAVRKDSCDEL